MATLKDSSGKAISVSDKEILEAQAELAHCEGLFVEPASAATFAAARKLRAQGMVDRSDRVVALATGSGLNMPEAVFDYRASPAEISYSLEELSQIIRP